MLTKILRGISKRAATASFGLEATGATLSLITIRIVHREMQSQYSDIFAHMAIFPIVSTFAAASACVDLIRQAADDAIELLEKTPIQNQP